MGYAYYRIWASQVIYFCWLMVVVQQGVGVVWRPDGGVVWLWPPPISLVRRELSEAEQAEYAAARARVPREVWLGLWVGLLGWAVGSLACGPRTAVAGSGRWQRRGWWERRWPVGRRSPRRRPGKPWTRGGPSTWPRAKRSCG